MNGVKHGGRVFALARQLGCSPAEILDFSASINPLGPPPAVLEAAEAALTGVCHYPDPMAETLVADLAASHQLSSEQLLAGSGATEFIFAVPRALGCRRALVVEPAFAEYAVALQQASSKVDRLLLSADKDFALEAATLVAALRPDTDLLVLANPANPSGTGLTRRQMDDLLTAVPESLTVLVDEAFIDFCPTHSVLDQVTERPNLLVLRSMTKFYAIPGLRVGYLAGSEPLIRKLLARREPWRLSVPAIAAARACLHETGYRRETLARIADWRAALAERLAGLGHYVYPAMANYLLCRLPPGSPGAGVLAEQLAAQQILIRSCDNFIGLNQRFIRVAVRQPEENLRLLKALEEALQIEPGELP